MRRCDNCKRNLFCDSVWKTSGDRVTSCVSWTPIITNADKIRTMTDEELAKHIVCQWEGCKNMDVECDKCLLNWLKEEAQDADINQDC